MPTEIRPAPSWARTVPRRWTSCSRRPRWQLPDIRMSSDPCVKGSSLYSYTNETFPCRRDRRRSVDHSEDRTTPPKKSRIEESPPNYQSANNVENSNGKENCRERSVTPEQDTPADLSSSSVKANVRDLPKSSDGARTASDTSHHFRRGLDPPRLNSTRMTWNLNRWNLCVTIGKR